MIKKMALCIVLILILVPAFAMAAGPQARGSDATRENCTQSQQQLATQVQMSNQQQNNGECQMLRNCDGNEEVNREGVIAQNQIRMYGATAAGQGAVISAADQQQDQSRGRTGNQMGKRVRDRTNIQDGSCGNCPA